MRAPALAFLALAASALHAEQQPFERYQPIIDRQMFGQPPPNFDPAKPPSEAPRGGVRGSEEELTREQAVIKSSIHFSAINVTPDGATAVGFTDNSNPKTPVHYYLKVGEERNGWKVTEADPVKAEMTIVKDEVEVTLKLGENSGGGKGGARGGVNAANAATRDMAGRGLGAGQRAGLLGARRGAFAAGAASSAGTADGEAGKPGGSLRERRAQREAERAAEEAKERAKREAEREEQRKELQLLKDELKAQRDAAEKERAEREAERAAREAERAARANDQQQQVDGNAED